MLMRNVVSFFAVLFCLCASQAFAGLIATFDTLAEGPAAPIGGSFTDGGITFFDPRDTDGSLQRFVIERADGTLSGPDFSPPNALTMFGFVPGPGAAFSRMGSFHMTVGSIQDGISTDIFVYVFSGVDLGNNINLELTLNGMPVGSTSLILAGFGLQHYTLSIPGVSFDDARLFGSGNSQQGAWFGMVDNVTMGTQAIIPEPASLVLLITGGFCLLAHKVGKARVGCAEERSASFALLD